jgi:hypothetical protein
MKRSVRFLGPLGILGVGLLIAAVSAARSPNDTIAAQGATVSLVPSSQVVDLGDTFTVDFSAENVTNLAAFEFKVSFDPNVLNVESVSQTDFLGSTDRNISCERVTDPIAVPPGNVWFGCVSSASGDAVLPSGSGVLATVTFRAIGDGVSPLIFRKVELTDDFAINCCAPITIREAAVQVPAPDEPTPRDLPPTPTLDPTAMTPTPNPVAPPPSSGPLLPSSDDQSAAGGAGSRYAPGGAATGGEGQGGTSGSPRAGEGPPEKDAAWWPMLIAGLFAAGGAALLSLAFYVRRAEPGRRIRH